ncbi:GNAT family N-acetyltransferase [Streptococcus sp. sy010]|uniref:GNAT family N-acetyltransferase n=1 Tax=Streptococcus sp. sy010 TaxID=2600148 RepID=UPI0011B38C49|nr:GNAT family N-acetyltransferase [Streptococcus sp. sy010]TWT16743.1 GNAT family N-acetyltransferase [Streptococcus sp. sy010]
MSKSPWLILAEHQIIETPRLRLRPLSLADAEDYHEFNMDDDLLKYSYMASRTKEESLEELVLWNLKTPLGRYGIELLSEGKIIGNSSIRLDDTNTKAEIGITLNRHYHHQGYARETLAALRDLAVSMPTVNYLKASCNQDNQASRAVLEAIGMNLEEILENTTSLRGHQITTLIYGLDVSKNA